jgi:hypothetical protein
MTAAIDNGPTPPPLPVPPPPDRPSWLRPILPQIVAGIIGLIGGVLGASSTGYVQWHLEQQRAVEAEKQRRLDRAEEIVTLVEKTPVTYIETKKAMMLEPTHLMSPPMDSQRVTALVALYFPDASEAARSFEGACAEHAEVLSEIAIQMNQGTRPHKDDSVTYQRMLTAGDIVIAEVLKDVGVDYKRRVPVAP